MPPPRRPARKLARKPAAADRRRRLPPDERERSILREATRYFAEHGLSAGTVDLARRIGISQPLLYRYFPTKDAMIGKVFEGLFPGHWDPRWETLLNDATVPIAQRLKAFYRDYANAVLTYEHVRLFLFSGLAGLPFNAQYYEILTQRIFTPIALALRATHADRAPAEAPVTVDELEIVQSLHASVYHIAFRRWIHGAPPPLDMATLIERKVDAFLAGAQAAVAKAAPARVAAPRLRANARR